MLVIFANLTSCNGSMFFNSSKLISTFLNTSFFVLTISLSLHSVKKCMIFSLPLLQSLQFISSDFPILCRCSLSPQCPVINPVMTRRSILLIDLMKLNFSKSKLLMKYPKFFPFTILSSLRFACFSSHFLIISSKFLVLMGS